MEPQKPGNSPGPGLEVVERQKIIKKRATQRVRSWTVQNEIEVSWDGCPQALHEEFSILPMLER